MALNDKQKFFFEELKKGRNIFLTGEAGTGKSFCIKSLIEELTKREAPFGVTATTGTAALNVGGSTIHSWAGIGLGEESQEFLVSRLRKMTGIRTRIIKTKILIIDEISMLSAEMLDKLDYIFKKIRGKNKPFGGIQMIFTGDFLQAPLISINNIRKFAFESKAWKEANIQIVELTEQVRQKDDEGFADILGELRRGKTSRIKELLENKSFPDDGIKPIVVICLNKLVEKHNEQEIAKLDGKEQKYFCSTKGDSKDVAALIKSCPALEVVSLKVKAQVILLKNLDVEGGLVNGSLGVVTKLSPNSVTVRFPNGEHEIERHTWEFKKQSITDEGTKFNVAATLNQIPLKLAYSITIHKCQGMTLSRVILDATGIFDDGLGYVALSRVENKKNLIIKNLNINKITANKKALEFYGYEVSSDNDDPFEW